MILRRSIRDITLWLIGRRRRFIIQGDSMLPTLRSEDWVLVEDGFYDNQQPIRGELVLIEHPQRPGYVLVKRITSVEDDVVMVLGDNPDNSTDSRHFGPVHQSKLLARVWSRL